MDDVQIRSYQATSRPARGAWIEMEVRMNKDVKYLSRAPHGARGLKYLVNQFERDHVGRAPHGARGLKCLRPQPKRCGGGVAPRTGRVD